MCCLLSFAWRIAHPISNVQFINRLLKSNTSHHYHAMRNLRSIRCMLLLWFFCITSFHPKKENVYSREMVEINTEIRFLDAYLMGEYSPIDTAWRCMIIPCMSMKWISYEKPLNVPAPIRLIQNTYQAWPPKKVPLQLWTIRWRGTNKVHKAYSLLIGSFL